MTARLGVGTSFNAFAARSSSSASSGFIVGGGGGGGSGSAIVSLLALLVPKVEVVWGAPTALDPSAHFVEVRIGVGF